MKTLEITVAVKTYSLGELDSGDRQLVLAAKKATERSYAPYSGFSVGAAALLANGVVVTGTNQENVAYPSGLCAERTALFYAGSQYPDQPVVALAVAARTGGHFVDSPIPPCGACRQVMLETEARHNRSFRLLLCGAREIYRIDRAADLLPLSFDGSAMEK
ncbi:MAG: cytidine deaminase [Mediterranea sp.]|jgi:cytidine deaminase|nr:cytidine deaminase [Mediterranea sp.]